MDKVLYRSGYEDLANAVVSMAAEDYRRAWKKYKKGDEKALREITNIENFFKTKRANLYSHGLAKDILRRLQEEQKEKPKKPKRTVKITKVERYE